jgi:hypothetical protein
MWQEDCNRRGYWRPARQAERFSLRGRRRCGLLRALRTREKTTQGPEDDVATQIVVEKIAVAGVRCHAR